jgi:hypothetical protein
MATGIPRGLLLGAPPLVLDRFAAACRDLGPPDRRRRYHASSRRAERVADAASLRFADQCRRCGRDIATSGTGQLIAEVLPPGTNGFACAARCAAWPASATAASSASARRRRSV